MNNYPTKSTHSDKLERWLGKDKVENLIQQYNNFYWPIPVRGVPGNVFIMPGGDFAGEIKAGSYMSAKDSAPLTFRKLYDRALKLEKREKGMKTLLRLLKAENNSFLSVGAFANADAVIAAFTGGKGQVLYFNKTGVTANGTAGVQDLWSRTGTPPAGGAGSAAPGGVNPTAATTGALTFANLGTANTGHYLNWSLNSSVANMGLLLYDRLFAVVKTMNSTATESVTGTLTRYNSTTAGASDFAGGNFCFPANPTTVLAATAHNWTVCQYTNQAGTTARSFTSLAGVSSCVVGGVDLLAGNWFMPLVAGDSGVKALTQMQCSAAVATGTIDFVIGHPIAINVCPIANLATLDDGLYPTLNLSPILDNACLSFLELPKSASTATTYSGIVRAVSE